MTKTGKLRRKQVSALFSRIRSIAQTEQLGPGWVTGAADDDPSGIATYSQAGAQFGFGLTWTLVLTFPLMAAIQLVSAHIGRVTGRGLAYNMTKIMPFSAVNTLVALLFIANAINIGADISAMGETAKLIFGWSQHSFTLIFAAFSLLLQIFVPYQKYARFLMVLTLSLFSYVALVFTMQVNWRAVGLSIIGAQWVLSKDAVITVVAIFGTTISPYLFFWQSAQEVEEVNHHPGEKPLLDDPAEAPGAFRHMEIDTVLGMFISNLVALAIMISTAATLHAAGKTNIATAADAAQALEPLAGKFAFVLFALGIIGTGLLAVPVLAGSAAYAVGDTRGWKVSLDAKPWEAIGFYSVIGVAVALGLAIDYSGQDPMRALFWSAVVNGVIAVPLMAAMMMAAGSRRLMGQFRAGLGLSLLGWLSTAIMAGATAAMVWLSL